MAVGALAASGCVNEAAIQKAPGTWTYKENHDAATDGRVEANTGPQARYGARTAPEFSPPLGGSGGYQGVGPQPLGGITGNKRTAQRAESGTGSAPGADRPATSFQLESSQQKTSGTPIQPSASRLPAAPRRTSPPNSAPNTNGAAGAGGGAIPGPATGAAGRGSGAGAGRAGQGAAGATSGANGASGQGTNGGGAASGAAGSPPAGGQASTVVGVRAGEGSASGAATPR